VVQEDDLRVEQEELSHDVSSRVSRRRSMKFDGCRGRECTLALRDSGKSPDAPGTAHEATRFRRSVGSRSLKQALSFGCRLLRLGCSTCGVAPDLAWP
jgi:hypothetical protein